MSLWLSDFFFFFKQKTAYEMRISDWSSDVCSSDLTGDRPSPWYSRNRCLHPELSLAAPYVFAPVGVSAGESITRGFPKYKGNADECMCAVRLGACIHQRFRSEEHTSELQSLMRISYAVFCLKKKKQQKLNKDLITNTDKQLVYQRTESD